MKVALRTNDDGEQYNRVRRFNVVGVDEPKRDPFAPDDGPAEDPRLNDDRDESHEKNGDTSGDGTVVGKSQSNEQASNINSEDDADAKAGASEFVGGDSTSWARN